MPEVKRIHVIKRKNGWAVRKHGAQRATKIYKLKEDAINNAITYRKLGFTVVVHKKDASVEKWIEPLTLPNNGQVRRMLHKVAS